MMNEKIREDLQDKVDEMVHDFYWQFRDDVTDEGGHQLIMIMERLRYELTPILMDKATEDSRYAEPWKQNWHGKYTDEEQALGGYKDPADLSDVNYTGDESVHDLAKIESQEHDLSSCGDQ